MPDFLSVYTPHVYTPCVLACTTQLRASLDGPSIQEQPPKVPMMFPGCAEGVPEMRPEIFTGLAEDVSDVCPEFSKDVPWISQKTFPGCSQDVFRMTCPKNCPRIVPELPQGVSRMENPGGHDS